MAKKIKYGHRESFPRYFKADFELQQKIGTGTLDAGAVAEVQKYLDSVQADITPELQGYLAQIDAALADARGMTYDREQFLPAITRPLMDMKSMSGMFHEMMVCRISSFMLTFIEDVRRLDNDMMEIMSAYVKVTRAVLDLKIREETNPYGQNFLAEIRSACKRYYDKQAAKKA